MKVALSCLTLCDPMDYTVHGIIYNRILEWLALPFSRGSSQPSDRTQVSCIANRVFTCLAEPQGKTKNTGVGSLSLLQGIFQIQGSNQGVLHCRQIKKTEVLISIIVSAKCPGKLSMQKSSDKV